VLLLGGARSGKSKYALTMVESSGLSPLYCATGIATDREMEVRIARHQRDRNPRWKAVETPYGFEVLERESLSGWGVVVDCITFLANNLFWREKDPEKAFLLLEEQLGKLFKKREEEGFFLVFVSNEVGMGIVPEHPTGRSFRDLQGRINQWLASRVQEVYFLIAGIPWRIK